MNTYTENYHINQNGLPLFLGTIIFIIFVLVIYWFKKVEPMLKERRYIKAEIRRSLSVEERREWENELKDLYIRSIPIIGKLLR